MAVQTESNAFARELLSQSAEQLVSIMDHWRDLEEWKDGYKTEPSVSWKTKLAGLIWHDLKQMRNDLETFKQLFAKEYGELIGGALAAEEE